MLSMEYNSCHGEMSFAGCPVVDYFLNDDKNQAITAIFPHDLVVGLIRENLHAAALLSLRVIEALLSEIIENIYNQGRP